jgi:TolB protein
MTFFDRQGKPAGTVGDPGVYSQAALSPDGTQVAVIRNDQGTTHVWVYDVATGKGTPITSDATPNASPVWSPDGRQIAYVASFQRDGYSAICRKSSDGSGKEEMLYKHTPGAAVFLTDWSVTGQLSFWSGDSVYALPLDGERKPVEIVGGKFGARGGRFSPDGNYLAYSANMGGGNAIYVVSLKNPSQKAVRVSTAPALGGIFWREDGKELYFMALTGLAPTGVMAVDLTLGPELQAGTLAFLFRPIGVNSPAQLSNIASRDGQRFLFLPGAN